MSCANNRTVHLLIRMGLHRVDELAAENACAPRRPTCARSFSASTAGAEPRRRSSQSPRRCSRRPTTCSSMGSTTTTSAPITSIAATRPSSLDASFDGFTILVSPSRSVLRHDSPGMSLERTGPPPEGLWSRAGAVRDAPVSSPPDRMARTSPPVRRSPAGFMSRVMRPITLGAFRPGPDTAPGSR